MNAPNPILFTTLDGVERSFRLTNTRLLESMHRKAAHKTEDDEVPLMTMMRPNFIFLWSVCDNREDIAKPDDFLELLPLDPELINGLIGAIHAEWSSRSKIEANEKYRPTKAEILPSDGSGLQPSGESTSEALTSSGN